MAAVARRSWSSLKTEFLKRSGGLNYSGWSDRAEQFLKAAYVDICTLYSHQELFDFTTVSVTSTQNYISLPSDYLAIFAISEINSGGSVPTRLLSRMTLAEYLSSGQDGSQARPSRYFIRSRVVNDVQADELAVFDVQYCDATRHYAIWYQARPADPDISASDEYPQVGEQWDEHILEHALYKAGLAIGDQQLAATNAALFKDFVSQSGQRLLNESPTSQDEVKVGANRMTSHKIP